MIGALAVGTLALVAAGCGGGGDNAAADQTTVEETTTEITGSATDTSATDTSATDTETTSDALGSGNVDLGSLPKECVALASVGAKFSQAIQSANGTGSGDVETYVQAFDEYAKAAPDEIKDDIEVIGQNLAKVAEALKGVDLSSGATPTPEQIAKLQEIGKTFDDTKLKQASAHIQSWVSQHCSKS